MSQQQVSRINDVLFYIHQDISRELSAKELADVAAYSEQHFHRIFKAVTGESPYDSLLRLRLEKSIFLLKYRAKWTITEIAYESGFPSPENFSRWRSVMKSIAVRAPSIVMLGEASAAFNRAS